MQTVTNALDQGRVFPTTAIASANMTETDGIRLEKITGPNTSAVVVLSYPASAIVHIQSVVTASGAWAAVPNPVLGTDYSVTLVNANGVAALTEGGVGDQRANTWVVWYKASFQDATPGNQSVAQAGV